ncbi:hypothetical protein HNQ91_000825 [Filimonas zeae]|nr:DUF5703 domain-containing protein [Filimonas zeae]MDR6337803.1 hypothetical protein [Filimonas zeae]
MKRTALTMLLAGVICLGRAQQPKGVSVYDVVWTSQSENASASMPCGGGDIGLNVWVEQTGMIHCTLSRNGAFDENNMLLKQGEVVFQLSGAPFSILNKKPFRQQLRLETGDVLIEGNGVSVLLWVDVYRPVVHVSVQSARPLTVTAEYKNWRYKDYLIQDKEQRAASYKFTQKFPVYTRKDEAGFENGAVVFYHRNHSDREDIFDYTVRMERLSAIKDSLWNPVKDRTFGGYMKGKGFKPLLSPDSSLSKHANRNALRWTLQSSKGRQHELEIGLHVAQTATLAAWKQGLQQIADDATAHYKSAQQQTRSWWKQFWNRSYIHINSADDSVKAIARNYQLFRYMLGCNAYGAYPSKSNGGLFTFEPEYVNAQYPFSADFRLWGGGVMTAQNQRLVYFPMLKSGDADMMKPQFDFYLNALKNAELRTRYYWHHNGASFTEQMEYFGLPNIAEYGIKRPEGYDAGMEYNAWLEYQWETCFEFCLMILDAERYAGMDITAYIPLIESCLTFYDEHYQYLAKKLGARVWNDKGQYVFYPSSAAETYKMAYNSTTVVSALTVILTRVGELPQQYLDTAQRRKWATMLTRIPEVPVKVQDGRAMLAPAEAWARVQNSEAPQLYPVYPWGLYGVGKPGLDTAINTWLYDPQVVKYRSHVGWRQYNIFAARLGLTAEAAHYNKLKLADGPHRFPAFWGPGFDWTPDHNWGGSGMIGLQEMLLQADGKKMYLLPAWPKDWPVECKLHAPYNTTVELSVTNGKVTRLQVTPESRRQDVIMANQWLPSAP